MVAKDGACGFSNSEIFHLATNVSSQPVIYAVSLMISLTRLGVDGDVEEDFGGLGHGDLSRWVWWS